MPFSEPHANRACNFFKHILKHTADEWYGKPFLLAPWEEDALRTIFGTIDEKGDRVIEMALMELPKKSGKALALDTQIPTPSGWTTMADINVGATVFDDRGDLCTVTSTSEIFVDHDCYEIEFSNGERIIADAGHRWMTSALINEPGRRIGRKMRRWTEPTLRQHIIGGKKYWYANLHKKQVYLGTAEDESVNVRFAALAEADIVMHPVGEDNLRRTRTTEEICRTQRTSQGCNHSIDMPDPLNLPEADLPIDPYALGVWLGDGTSANAAITCGELDLEEMVSNLEGLGYYISQSKSNTAWRLQIQATELTMFGDTVKVSVASPENFQHRLRSLGVLNNKHIPGQYLRSSIAQRLALLQGLMDTDGTADKTGKGLHFSTVKEHLAKQVGELVASLGIKYRIQEKPLRCNGKPVSGIGYTVSFHVFADQLPVFRLRRKLARMRMFTQNTMAARSQTVQIRDVRRCQTVPVKCIAVDSKSHLYLCGRTMIPTHNTEFCAGVLLFILATSDMPGCQIYGAAAATRQAMNVYRAAAKMVEQSPLLSSQLRILRGTNRIVKRTDRDSFYAAVAADGDFGDGVNPAFVVADELHRWRTRKHVENWDVLSNGGITRRQTLTIAITTAGVQNESPLAWRLHEKARKIQDGIIEDDKFYGRIYGAEKTDDPADPKTWIKANPSLKENGGFLDLSKIREKYESHLAEGDLTSFKRYFLNIWDQKENRAIDMVKWDRSKGPWTAEGLQEQSPDDKVRPLPHNVLQRFIERPCFAGVDLSMTTDLSAVSFVFPCDDGGYDVLVFFWCPDEGVRKRETRDGMPYRKWAEQGFIELCPGPFVDYDELGKRLRWGASMFDLKEICLDPWNSRQLSVGLTEEGYKCMEVRQGFQTLSEPTKKVLQLVEAGKLYHGGHPVLRWNASCASLKETNDNMLFEKPERAKSTSRIDGLAATVNALSRAIEVGRLTSIYEERGIRSI